MLRPVVRLERECVVQDQNPGSDWVFIATALAISSLIFFAGMAFYVMVIAPPR